MNKREAKEVMNKIKDVMDNYPSLTYGIFIHDEQSATVSANKCIRCISDALAEFINDNDIKHDAEYDKPEDIRNDDDKAIH